MTPLEQQLETYVRRHARTGLLLDTNVLLLMLAFQFDPSLVGGRRLEKYTAEDAELLMAFVDRFHRVLTTTHVLTETSNLAFQVLSGSSRTAFFQALYPTFTGRAANSLALMRVKRERVSREIFIRLGITDAALTDAARRGGVLLTDDLDLHSAASSRGIPSVNFTHMREAAGLL